MAKVHQGQAIRINRNCFFDAFALPSGSIHYPPGAESVTLLRDMHIPVGSAVRLLLPKAREKDRLAMAQRVIYLDYNASTPIKREVADVMAPYLYEHFGNPSNGHIFGQAARHAINRARAQVAALIDAAPEEIIFTGGGTEANNLAIKGVAEAYGYRGRHIVTSTIEHPAVLEPCRWLAQHGWQVTFVPVDKEGRVDPADIERAMTPETVLVSIMHANNEVGTIQPIRAIADIVHAGGALFHVDAAQTIGKIMVKVKVLGVDLLSIAGHKFYGPKGVGALYVRDGVTVAPLIHGANQEDGRRAGTENVHGIVGLGEAAFLAERDLQQNLAHMRAMRDRLYDRLRAAFPPDAMRLNGAPEGRLPNTLSVSFRGVRANDLLDRINHAVAASAGAACHSDDVRISYVLQAMGVPAEYAMGTLRLSVGAPTQADDIDRAARVVIDAVRALQPA